MSRALEKDLDVPLGLDGEAGQIDGGEAQVAPAIADFPLRVIGVGDDPGAAAHIGDLRFRVSFPIVLGVEGGVLK